MGFFSSGLFKSGSSEDREDGAAFDAAVSGTPGASREKVKWLARQEAGTVKALRKGEPVDVSGPSAWDNSSDADKRAFGRYIHSRPQPW